MTGQADPQELAIWYVEYTTHDQTGWHESDTMTWDEATAFVDALFAEHGMCDEDGRNVEYFIQQIPDPFE
jgi:hypothetical protein